MAMLPGLPPRRTLEDGSFVELRGDAALRVAYTPSVRRVELVRGEAHFNVAHDSMRPFVVLAGRVEFRAVGTAFSVQLGETNVDLIVTAGRVAVDCAGTGIGTAAPRTLALVEKGSHVALRRDALPATPPTVVPLPEGELGRRLAWRAPRLEFSATPLATALEMIQRAAAAAAIEPPPRLEIGDAGLAEVRLSGVLRADNIDTLVGVLEANYGIRAERQPDGRIVLRAR